MMDSDVVYEGAVTRVKEGLCVIVDALLRRAQSVGAVRSEVTALLVVTLVVGASEAAAHEGSAPACDLLVILCDGLRPRSSESLCCRRCSSPPCSAVSSQVSRGPRSGR